MNGVFDDKPRDDGDWAAGNESTYSWLDRSGRELAVRARTELERLYAQYPDPFGRLLNNLRATAPEGVNNPFCAALASLIMFDRLKALGFSIEVDEEISGHQSRPDLLLTRADEDPIAIEIMTLCMKRDLAEEDRRLNALTDSINASVSSDAYSLGVSVRGTLSDDFDLGPVIEEIRQTLGHLPDPGERGPGARDLWRTDEVMHDGCTIELTYIPLSSARRRSRSSGEEGHMVDIHPARVGWTASESRIKSKLRGKHPSKYDLPEDTSFVQLVALNDAFAGDDALQYAMWGSEALRLVSTDPEDAELVRLPNGHFTPRSSGGRNTAVCGVLALRMLAAQLFSDEEPRLDYYDNPFAERRLDGRLLGAERVFGVVSQTADGLELGWLQ